MIKGVIFDMDGVLVDNRDIHIEAFRILCKRYGVPFDDSMLNSLYGRGNDTIMPMLLPQEIIDRVGLTALDWEKEAIYRDIYVDSVSPARGLLDFLALLRAAGVKRAVGSSAPTANVNFVLEKCHIQDDFDVVVSGSMVQLRKPWPDIFLLAAELLGLMPQECLVFEDSVAGIEAAQAAGTPVIAMATTLPRERLAEIHKGLIISDFTEVDLGTLGRF